MNWPHSKPDIEKPKKLTRTQHRLLLAERAEQQIKTIDDWRRITKMVFASTGDHNLLQTLDETRAVLADCARELKGQH